MREEARRSLRRQKDQTSSRYRLFQTAIKPTQARITGVGFFDRAHGVKGAGYGRPPRAELSTMDCPRAGSPSTKPGSPTGALQAGNFTVAASGDTDVGAFQSPLNIGADIQIQTPLGLEFTAFAPNQMRGRRHLLVAAGLPRTGRPSLLRGSRQGPAGDCSVVEVNGPKFVPVEL